MILTNKKSAIITAETGGGKTLAYVVPLLENLKKDSRKVIFLTPSRHLQLQLAQVVHSVAMQMEPKPSFCLAPPPPGLPPSKVPKALIHISSPSLLLEGFRKPKQLAAYLKGSAFLKLKKC